MTDAKPVEIDPLDDLDAYQGAVLLSDQIEYYVKELSPPLLQNPNRQSISESELAQCLDAASYKLRLGDEAHVGGKWVRISQDHPLVSLRTKWRWSRPTKSLISPVPDSPVEPEGQMGV